MKVSYKQLEYILEQHGFTISEYFKDIKTNMFLLSSIRNWLGY
jgi:hypothetical protein